MSWLKDIVGFLNKNHGLTISEEASGQEVAEALDGAKIPNYSEQIAALTGRLEALESAKPVEATLVVSEADVDGIAQKAATIAQTSLESLFTTKITETVETNNKKLKQEISADLNAFKTGKDIVPGQENLDLNKNKESKTEGSVTLKSGDLFASRNDSSMFNGLI